MRTVNSAVVLSKRNDPEGSVTGIQRSITQIWNKINVWGTVYDELNTKITTLFSRTELVVELVKAVHSHTSDIPDVMGFNKDHDRRYITRGEIRYWDTKRLVAADSPYTISLYDEEIFCDTDDGAITVNLPGGRDGLKYRIINCGSSGNLVTITPDGTECIDGVSASKTISDGTKDELCYEPTEGWW